MGILKGNGFNIKAAFEASVSRGLHVNPRRNDHSATSTLILASIRPIHPLFLQTTHLQ